MIRDKQEQTLFMDFRNIKMPYGHPSDIDMMWISRNGFLIIGEIKNSKGCLTNFQKEMLERFIDKHKGNGICLYITHNKDVHYGDTEVDVSECQVSQYYWRGKWRRPQKPTTVNEAIKALSPFIMGNQLI